MVGKNVFIERRWRSLSTEDITAKHADGHRPGMGRRRVTFYNPPATASGIGHTDTDGDFWRDRHHRRAAKGAVGI